jgi:hypothetical protein
LLNLCLDRGRGCSQNQHLVVAKNGVPLEIVYYNHLIEKKRYFQGLVWHSKVFEAIKGPK